jgi:NADH-quinone oxidoreductase subunit H
MSISAALFYVFIFPGLFFLIAYALLFNFLDRNWYAKLQNRVGPPFLQPLADIIKLFAKEDITPRHASAVIFNMVPIIAFASVCTSFFYIPIYKSAAISKIYFSFDLVAVLYLLTLPTVMLFLAGYFSVSLYSTIGAVRALSQLFAYEVPLCAVFLSPAIIAGSWSIIDIVGYFEAHPSHLLINVIGFVVAIIALQGKLERTPFDIPEAETEIVGGPLTEYSGKKLGMFRLVVNMEMVVGSSLIAAIFLGGFGVTQYLPQISFVIYLIKTLFILFILSVFRAIFARIRIDQMIDFGWYFLVPLAFAQIFISIMFKWWCL